jgi:hypothetical protein
LQLDGYAVTEGTFVAADLMRTYGGCFEMTELIAESLASLQSSPPHVSSGGGRDFAASYGFTPWGSNRPASAGSGPGSGRDEQLATEGSGRSGGGGSGGAAGAGPDLGIFAPQPETGPHWTSAQQRRTTGGAAAAAAADPWSAVGPGSSRLYGVLSSPKDYRCLLSPAALWGPDFAEAFRGLFDVPEYAAHFAEGRRPRRSDGHYGSDGCGSDSGSDSDRSES